MTPIADRGDRTRLRILDATAQLIADEGWQGVTIRKIATAADVNPALVNYHFGSKATLMREVLDRTLRTAVLDDREISQADPMTTASEMIGTALTMMRDSVAGRVLAEAMLAAAKDRTIAANLRPLLYEYRAGFAQALAAAIEANRLPGDTDPEALATGLVAMLDGLWLTHLVDPELTAERAKQAVEAVLTTRLPT